MIKSAIAKHKTSIGLRGEDIAVRFLRSRDYAILARRWRTRFGEIDIVAEYGGTLVFVEVKTRTTAGYGSPEESITHWKRQRLRRTAYAFLAARRLYDTPFRIDAIAVLLPPAGTATLRHLCSVVEED